MDQTEQMNQTKNTLRKEEHQHEDKAAHLFTISSSCGC